jgi:hypothetical protein
MICMTLASKKIAYEPEAPASAFRRGPSIHSLALRALAEVIVVHERAPPRGKPERRRIGSTKRGRIEFRNLRCAGGDGGERIFGLVEGGSSADRTGEVLVVELEFCNP